MAFTITVFMALGTLGSLGRHVTTVAGAAIRGFLP